MSSIQIKDTGKRSVSSTTVTEVRAYGDTGIGTTLDLKGAEATFGIEPMVTDDSPILRRQSNHPAAYFTWGEADTTGTQMPTWSVRGYCNRTVENDMIVLGRLIAMCQTAGYKELYSSNDTNFHDIIAYSHYGTREIDEESVKTVTYINVRIKSMSVTQDSNKKGFYYTLNLVETN
jgi:hypothetical protein